MQIFLSTASVTSPPVTKPTSSATLKPASSTIVKKAASTAVNDPLKDLMGN